MAAPRNRRPGFSRRVQLGLFLSYVIAVVGAVGALALVIVSEVDPLGFNALRGVAIDIGAPVTSTTREFVRGARAAEDAIKAYFFAASQNQSLHTELTNARRALIQARAMRLENDRLRATLRLRDVHPQTVVTARLIGSGMSSPRRFATLAAGTRDGVRPGQPVIAADGLVGRVLDTGGRAARILLLTDGESTVPVRLARNGTPALVRGNGNGTLMVRALLPGAAPFRKGDLVETTGTGGIYPPDVPVAIITEVNGDSALAWAARQP